MHAVQLTTVGKEPDESSGRIDLNLLKVFDAVYEDRNLVRCRAGRLNLSPSALSHALTRLREGVGWMSSRAHRSRAWMPTARATGDGGGAARRVRSHRKLTLGVEPFVPEGLVAPLRRRCQRSCDGGHRRCLLVRRLPGGGAAASTW